MTALFKSLWILALFTVFTIGCSNDSTVTNGGPTPEKEEPIGPAGGQVEVDDDSSPIAGYSIDIPSGALSSTATISLWTLASPLDPPTDRTPASDGFRIEPIDLDFTVPATVSIPRQLRAEDAAIYSYSSGIWRPLLPTTMDPQALSAPTSYSGTFQAFSGADSSSPSTSLDPATAMLPSAITEQMSFGECAFVRWFAATQDTVLMEWPPVSLQGQADDVAILANQEMADYRHHANWDVYSAPDDAIAFGLILALSDALYEPQLVVVDTETQSDNPHTVLVFDVDFDSEPLSFDVYDPYSNAENKHVQMTYDEAKLSLDNVDTYDFALLYDYITDESSLSRVKDHFNHEDTTPPGAIEDLEATSPTTDSITLEWKAPGDDGDNGTATAYDVRYSTSDPSITNQWWENAQTVDNEPLPLLADSNQSLIVEELAPGTTYYFMIKTTDDADNVSAVSNSASNRTLNPGDYNAYIAAARLALENELFEHLQFGADDPNAPDDVDFSAVLTNYQAALGIRPDAAEANFGVAIANVLTLSTDAEVNAAFDEWRAFLEEGSPFDYNSEPFQPLGVPLFLADPSQVLDMPFHFAPGMALALSSDTGLRTDPATEDLQDMIANVIAPRLETAVTRLTGLLDDDSFTYTVTPRMRGDEDADALEIDKTDVLALYAACQLLLGGCEAAQAYDLSVASYDLAGIHAALDQDTGTMFRLRLDGATHMGAVLPRFRAAADALGNAITSLLAETDDQSNDYIKVGPRDLDQVQVLDWRDEHLPAIQEALNGLSHHTLDWDRNDDTPEVELAVNIKAFFENPVQDFKLKAAPYTIETVPRPWGPQIGHDLSGSEEIGPVTITDAGYYQVDLFKGWLDYELRYTWDWSSEELSDAAVSFLNGKIQDIMEEEHWSGYANISANFNGNLNPGEQMVTVSYSITYSTAQTIVHVPVVVWDADDYSTWNAGFLDPSMNGLLPEIESAGEFLIILGYDPTYDWSKRLVLEWTAIDWQ